MPKKVLYGKSRFVPEIKSDLDLVSWLKRGKTRLQVFQAIEYRIMPSEVTKFVARDKKRAAESDFAQSSLAIAELEAQGLVECLNPLQKTGRLYSLTARGKRAKRLLAEN